MADTVKHIDFGGSAFPCEGGADSGLYSDPGMSLRDWFAGQALIALGQWLPAGYGNLDSAAAFQVRASISYKQADALIAARKAGA